MSSFAGSAVFNLLPSGADSLYGTSVFGFYKKALVHDDTVHYIDKERYEHLAYDETSHVFWAYDYANVFVAGKGVQHKYTWRNVGQLGVDKIEKVAFDKFGNTFLKGAASIVIYNKESGRHKEVLKGINLANAAMCISNGMLVVAGRFGIAFTRIVGRDSIMAPVIYPNFKDINYQYVYDLFAGSRTAVINTDKGVYEVPFPATDLVAHPAPVTDLFPIRFIVTYADSARGATTGDTIDMDQKNASLQFDIINPRGIGEVHYRYQVGNGPWVALNSNEFSLPRSFFPGQYYAVHLIASDNVWRSGDILLYVRMRPYWWQTVTGKRLLWGIVSGGILCILAIAVFITRKIVLRSAAKRNVQRDLELKAIYAQINPHFIFNTLNSALLLIRKQRHEEAYQHVAQFSRLLRSYLKSSRNKFISIAEEVVNLTDYLQLQQTRFVNKFRYTIAVHESINAEKVKIPSLLLQPFVENALKHGLQQKQGIGEVNIEFMPGGQAGQLVCTVDDNGVGRRATANTGGAADNEEGYGDVLVKELIGIFSKYENMHITISYLDKEPPLTGTLVKIIINNLYND